MVNAITSSNGIAAQLQAKADVLRILFSMGLDGRVIDSTWVAPCGIIRGEAVAVSGNLTVKVWTDAVEWKVYDATHEERILGRGRTVRGRVLRGEVTLREIKGRITADLIEVKSR